MFHISSAFDTDLFHLSLTRGGKNKHPVSICWAICPFFYLHCIFISVSYLMSQASTVFSSFVFLLLSKYFPWYISRLPGPVPVLTCARTACDREPTALYPFINRIAQALAAHFCCRIPINKLWQRSSQDSLRPATLTFLQREFNRKTSPLDTRTQSNLVQGGWNKAFHFRVLWRKWFQLNTPTSGLAQTSPKRNQWQRV